MAGCSIVVLWLLALPVVIMGVAGGLWFVVYLLYSWVFESIFCAHLCRNLWNRPWVLGWIPVWGQYLLGKASGSRGLGAALAVTHLMVLTLSMFIAAECVRVDGMVYLFFLALAVVLKAIVAHRLYKIAAPERYKVLSVISILTMGLLRPIFLFALRKKVCMFSKNT